MRFDEWFDEALQASTTSTAHLPLCPDGRHGGEIVKAGFANKSFKQSLANPEGTSLVLQVAVSGCQHVEAIIPKELRGLMEAVCRAAGVPPPQRGEDWDEKQLLGKQVQIETVLGMSAKGTEYVRITKWHKGPTQAPAKPPAARSQTAKAHKEFTAHADADDIPF